MFKIQERDTLTSNNSSFLDIKQDIPKCSECSFELSFGKEVEPKFESDHKMAQGSFLYVFEVRFIK